MKSLKIGSLADAVGIFSSVACAVHCLAIPTMLVAGSAIPAALALPEELFHRVMLLFVVPAAVIAFGIGCKKHKDRRVMVLGSIGIVGMVTSTFFLHDLIGENGERVVVLISAGLLMAAHLRNFKQCRAGACDHE